MSHDIYVFGSLVRGDVGKTSDIDILVVPFGRQHVHFPEEWSIYSSDVLEEYYACGRLFAWHLFLESKCIHSHNGTPYLEKLGKPSAYLTALQDIDELEKLLMQSLAEISLGTKSLIYELGITYTAIRDIAMSASWALMKSPCFSRNVPFLLPIPCPVSYFAYNGSMLARHSSMRGVDPAEIDAIQISQELLRAPVISWIQSLKKAI
jgi:hypothetical protein